MNLAGVYELFEKLWQHNQWVGFLVGLCVGGGAAAFALYKFLPFLVRGKIEASRFQAEGLREDLAALARENERLRLEKSEVEGRLEEMDQHRDSLRQLSATLEGQVKSVTSDLKKSNTAREKAQGDLVLERLKVTQVEAQLTQAGDELRARLAEVQDELAEVQAEYSARLDHGVRRRWDQPVRGGAVEFAPLHTRHMPIISMVNLKGGVGKTTLTANLGATLAKRGSRVLLIDLDYQGSLTSLCLSPEEYREARKAGRFVQDILRNGDVDRVREVFRNAIRLEDLGVGPASLLAADETLDFVESQALAHWLMGTEGVDIRLRLRAALHNPAIWAEFDVVLIDCPPRLSAGCINALAASDYALIPVVPEPISAEATPRLLAWLRNFQKTCCQQLSVLGVVGNRVKMHMGEPVRRHLDQWNNLKPSCHTEWGSQVRFFDRAMVRQFNSLPHPLAALTPDGRPVMEDLVQHISQDMPPYARLRAAAVPPLAHPAAAGVRG